MITERPSPAPTIATSASLRSPQKSDCCCVVTRLVSSARLEPVGALVVPGAEAAEPISVTAPEVTRVSDWPRRWPGR